MTDRGFDVLIENGLVVDGTGNPGYHANVGVCDGLIRIVRGHTGDIPAAERIDATGKVVAPGFIDIHSHSDLVLLHDPMLEMKIRQGVTTEVIGVDGLSYAPFADAADLHAFTQQNGGIAGLPPAALSWRTVGEQLEAYDGRTTVNVATLVGNTPLRIQRAGVGCRTGGSAGDRGDASHAAGGHVRRRIRSIHRSGLPAGKSCQHRRGGRPGS